MSVITMMDGGWHHVPEEMVPVVNGAMRAGVKRLDLYSDSSVIINAASITALLSDSQFEKQERIRQGDRECGYGFWHKKNEGCGHAPVTVPGAQVVRKTGKKEHTATWLKVIGLNADRGPGQGRIKTFDELRAYEATGEWPAYVSLGNWPRVTPDGRLKG